MGEPGELLYDVAFPDRLSRGLIFVKWLLAIPHFVVLWFLGIALAAVTFIAWFAILFTGRYPRGMWDFAMMTLRWTARVHAYTGLMRDEYPPFGDEAYPIRFAAIYPEQLSRWKIFVKWLLIIPHLIIVYLLNILWSIVTFIAWFAILFTGTYPRGLFDLAVGCLRWNYRVTLYVLLLSDVYPPFEMGPDPTPPSEYTSPPSTALGAA
jgi:hypothetical protein